MPYISKPLRNMKGPARCNMGDALGTLAFVLTQECQSWLGKGHSYTAYAEVVGILETVKLELYRRLVVPYEDTKRKENGDVYEPIDIA